MIFKVMLLVDQQQTFSISRIDEKTTYLEDSRSDGPTFHFLSIYTGTQAPPFVI